jgi:hypothetical protein
MMLTGGSVKQPLGLPRKGWEDNIKMNLRERGFEDGRLMELAFYCAHWRHVVVLKFHDICVRFSNDMFKCH